MADILLDTQAAPAAPSASTGVLYLDSTSKELVNYDEAGFKKTVRTLTNANTTDQAPAVTDTYIANSNLLVPPGLVRVGTQFIWRFGMTKTGAGVATPIWIVRVGTAGTTADTARLTFTGVAQTAAIDTASVEIKVIVRSIGASGVIQGTYSLAHVLAATGFSVSNTDIVNVTSGAFDTTVASSIYGVSVTPGTAAAWTINHASVQAVSI